MTGQKDYLPVSFRKEQTSVMLGVSLLILWTLVGTLGFISIEGWSFLDAFYMTIITLSTVGFGEIHPLSSQGRLFATFLIVTGIGTAIYTFTRLGQVLLEGELQGLLGRKRMNKEVAKLKDHYIVCGFGRIGKPVAKDLKQEGYPVCILESDPGREAEIQAAEHLYLIGDATDESVLSSAGIKKAKAVLALLPSDADNLFVTITVKELNPQVMVIARAYDEKVEPRLKRSGADKVISPYKTASARIFHAAIKPTVVEFLELVTHREYLQLNMEELTVCDQSPFQGHTLAESEIGRKYSVVVVAIKQADGEMAFNPETSTELATDDILVVIGKYSDLKRLERDCKGK
ncbi:MAG: potassium channel protein [candidate division NC10 bacterium]|nr:potassium channel protein [candidate division NC10 bacterium]